MQDNDTTTPDSRLGEPTTGTQTGNESTQTGNGMTRNDSIDNKSSINGSVKQ